MDWIKKQPIAHRGLHNKNISENTKEAFKAAVYKKYSIECDVVLSKDHEVVVFHDENLMRLCSVDQNVHELNMNELRKHKINDSQSNIISLDEMLHIVSAAVPIIIEIKGDYTPFIEDRIQEIIRSYSGIIALKSFSLRSINKIIETFPFMNKGLVVDNNNNNSNDILDMDLDFISCDINIIDSILIKKIRNKNIPIITWTIDNLDKKKKAEMYADNIIFENLIP